MKDAYFFSHDSNAKDDPKCVMLIEQLGLEGYGIYWVLIETLRDQPLYRYPVALIPALARRYNTTAEKMRTVVNSYGLFVVDENEFFSLSLMERMENLDCKRELARLAGKKSAVKRALLNTGSTDVQQTLDGCSTDVQLVKYSKVNESKVKHKNHYSEFVTMTPEEYQKLVDVYGEEATKQMIDILDNYEGSKGKTYKDDYRAILSWVVKRYEEDCKQIKLQPKLSYFEEQKQKRAAVIEVIKNATAYRDWETDRKSTRLNSSHSAKSRMPSSA